MLTLKRSVSTGSEGIVKKKRKQNNVEFHPLEETIQMQKEISCTLNFETADVNTNTI